MVSLKQVGNKQYPASACHLLLFNKICQDKCIYQGAISQAKSERYDWFCQCKRHYLCVCVLSTLRLHIPSIINCWDSQLREIFLKSTMLFQRYSPFASKARHKEFVLLLLRLSCFYLEKCWPFLFLQLQETSIAAFTLLCLLFPSWWLTWHKQQISSAASLRKTNKQQTESKKNFGKISRETMCYG